MGDRVGIGLVLLSAVGFGTLGIFGKLAAAAGLSIPTVLAFRFLVATLVVWGWLGATGDLRRLGRRHLALGLGLGAFGYATVSGLYFWGLEYLTAGLVAIVLYTYPAFVFAFAVATLDERVTRWTLLALGLALAGVVLIAGGDTAAVDPRGVGIVLGASVVYAAYITVSRSVLRTVPSRTLTAYVIPAAAAIYFGYGVVTGTLSVPTTRTEWALVVGVGLVATALPILTFFAGIARLGASRASVVSTVEPATTLALGALVLGEPVSVVTVVGGVLVVAGVVLVELE